MDACPLLITSIVAVKPEDQGTFFQDFLGLSGYLCSVPEMLRTTMKPNGMRPAPHVLPKVSFRDKGYLLVGRMR
jgi:hypothetical protein